MRQIIAVALACSTGCAIPIYGGALITGGYSSYKTERHPEDPINEQITALSYNVVNLHFRCEITQTPTSTIVETTKSRYGAAWHGASIPVGIVELIGGALPLALTAGLDKDIPRAGSVALTLTAIDGFALLAGAIAIKPQRETQITKEPPPTLKLRQCPLGTQLDLNGKRYPIYSDGDTTRDAEDAFDGMMASNSSFQIITPQQTIDVAPTPEERCRWALLRGPSNSVPALCPTLQFPALGALRIKTPDNVQIIIRVER